MKIVQLTKHTFECFKLFSKHSICFRTFPIGSFRFWLLAMYFDVFVFCNFVIQIDILNIGTYLKDMFEYCFQKCPRSVNNSRTNYSKRFWGIWGPKWSYVV